MGLKQTEYRINAQIRNPEFNAQVPLYFSMIVSDEVYWTEHEEKLATQAIAIHILKKRSKEIQKEMENEMADLDDYGNN